MKKIDFLSKQDWKAAKALMSFFRRPITNKKPEAVPVSLLIVYNYVRSELAKAETEHLRTIVDHATARQYKGTHFDSITPGGTFTYAADNCLVEASEVLCVDFDHLDDDSSEMKRKISPEEMKKLLLVDPFWGEKTLLMFTSPRGHGVKWFVPIVLSICDYKTWYKALREYMMNTYGFGEKQIDPTVANISHACFLSYDPAAYIHPNLLTNEE